MQFIDYTVENQIISQSCPSRQTIEQSAGLVYARFTFDTEWDGLRVILFFDNDAAAEPVPVEWNGSDVEIPPAALVSGELRVSAVGTSGESNPYMRITTKRMERGLRIFRSGPIDGASQGPGKTLWEQILSSIGDMSKLDTTAKNTLVDAINEVAKKSGSAAIIGVSYKESSSEGFVYTIDLDDGSAFEFTAPFGPKGDPGDPGDAGVGIERIELVADIGGMNLYRIYLTDETAYDLSIPYGTTPQRGSDYWTDADKAEIVSDVLAALPTWNGGAY